MKKSKKLLMLVTLNISVLILIIATLFVVFQPQKQATTDFFQKPLFSQPNTEKLAAFIDEHQIRFRPTPLDDYHGPYATAIPILMYHDVIAEVLEEYDGNKMYVEDFRQHVIYLAENGYRTLTVDEFDRFYRGEIEVPEKSVLMTFDDGFRSVKELIEPILQEYNMHAVSFIIGEKTVNEPQWFVTPAEIKELETRNFIEFQSHSYHLHNAGSNGRGMIETISVEEMLVDYQKENELIGATDMFCYPFGHAEETAIDMLQMSNIPYGVTTAFGYATRDSNPYILPRIRINANTTVTQFANLIVY